MNSVLANVMDIDSHIDTIFTELDNVGEDLTKFNVAKINSNASMQHIKKIATVSNQRILDFDEGLKSIKRESNAFNLHKKIRGLFK